MNEHSKKILLIIPNLGFGGAEKSFAKLSLLLAQHHDVYVSVFNRDSYTEKSYPHGGTFIDLDVTTGNGIVAKIKAFLNRIRKVKAIKKQLGIEMTISFLEGADYINILAGGKDKKVISIRGSKKYDNNITGIFGWLRKKILIPLLYSRADVIVTVNKGISAELKHNFGVKKNVRFQTIPNYYNLEKIEQMAEEDLPVAVQPLFQYPVIISHGRLSRGKGFGRLLEIFAQIKKVQPKVRLVIVGDGPYYKQLTQRCIQLKLSFEKTRFKEQAPDVFFTGYQSNPFAWLSKSTIFALPSFTEGFPNALAEAMISGVAVVSADCPWGPRTIMQGKDYGNDFYFLDRPEYTANGVLLPMLNQPQAIDMWSEAINGMLDNAGQRIDLVRHARRRMRDFSSDRIAGQWYELLDF
jgi:glycosyltransferase involved in cell wall biosynthesis